MTQSRFAPAARPQAESQHLEYSKGDSVKPSDSADTSRRNFRVIHTALRRVRFVGRFIFWSVKHGSTKHAAWVCNYEGDTWN